ncbi:MAG: hypothetical protein ACLSG9_10155 [Eubacterium sp.]
MEQQDREQASDYDTPEGDKRGNATEKHEAVSPERVCVEYSKSQCLNTGQSGRFLHHLLRKMLTIEQFLVVERCRNYT